MPNVTINLEDGLLERAKIKARSECRSLSQQVAFLIMQDMAGTTGTLAIKPARKGGNMRKGATV